MPRWNEFGELKASRVQDLPEGRYSKDGLLGLSLRAVFWRALMGRNLQ